MFIVFLVNKLFNKITQNYGQCFSMEYDVSDFENEFRKLHENKNYFDSLFDLKKSFISLLHSSSMMPPVTVVLG